MKTNNSRLTRGTQYSQSDVIIIMISRWSASQSKRIDNTWGGLKRCSISVAIRCDWTIYSNWFNHSFARRIIRGTLNTVRNACKVRSSTCWLENQAAHLLENNKQKLNYFSDPASFIICLRYNSAGPDSTDCSVSIIVVSERFSCKTGFCNLRLCLTAAD